MNQYKKIAVIIIVLALMTINLPPKVSSAKASEGEDTILYVTVTVNGITRNVTVGDVVTTGSLTSQGYCEFPEIEVSYTATNSINYADTVFTTESDCDLVVSSIVQSTQYGSPDSLDLDGSMATPVNQSEGNEDINFETDDVAALYLGWAQMAFREQFGISVTKTRSEMSYQDNGSRVWDGEMENAFCWWTWTGWFNISCSETHAYGGPFIVYLKVVGEYDHPFHIWHKTSAKFKAVPGGWIKACSFVGKSPPFWSTRCTGGRN